MKVCVVGRGYPHKMQPSYRYPLYQRFIEEYDADIILFERKKLLLEERAAIPSGYEYHVCNPFPFIAEGIPLKLWNILRQRRYDLVISMETSWTGSLFAALAKKWFPYKLIVFSELWFYPRTWLGRLSRPIVAWVAKQPDALVLTWKGAESFHRSLGARQKIFFAPDAANDISVRPLDKQRRRELLQEINPHKRHVILYMGRFVRYKGLDTLIKAFAALEQDRDDCELVIIGKGPFGDYCQALILELGLKQVQVIDWVSFSDVPYYYSLADTFVLPGRFDWSGRCPAEAWGMTVLESMLMKTPVITTTAVAASSAISHGVDGYVVPPDDVKAITRCLEAVMRDPEQRKKMGVAARKKVKKYFNYERMFNGFQEAIEFVNKQE